MPDFELVRRILGSLVIVFGNKTEVKQVSDNSNVKLANYFLTVFGRPDSSSSCECERSGDPSLAQSLHLLNAKDIQDRYANTLRDVLRDIPGVFVQPRYGQELRRTVRLMSP